MDAPRVLQGSYDELETMESKIEWFRSLSFEERYWHIEEHMAFVQAVNPRLAEADEDRPSRSVRILRLP